MGKLRLEQKGWGIEMKKLILLVSIIGLLIWSSLAFGQAVETESGDTLMISEIDANWTYSNNCMMYGVSGEGRRMNWIMFSGASAWGLGYGDSYITVREGSVTGPVIYYSASCALDTNQTFTPIYFFGSRLRPVIDFSASSVAHDQSYIIFKLWPEK
jgi:hypothetical protein